MAAPNRDALSRIVDRRIALAREWDGLVEQVRQLGPQLGDFLRPPRAGSLLPAVGDGAAVLVNVTARRCDALVVTADGVRPVRLPDLTADEAGELAAEHLDRLAEVDRTAAELHLARDRVTRRADAATFQAHHAANLAAQRAQGELDRHLVTALRRLWDVVAEPVLATLPEPSRVWWCPTGPLNFLPLHAAGRHDRPGSSVLDRTVSSYTPTLRALARARPTGAEATEPGRMLVVAVPEAPDAPPLPQAADEAELIRALVPADQLTVLAGEEATRAAVLAALPAHRWAHFSCHGTPDDEHPSRGGLLLHDGRITVADVGRGRYHGEFAFLSACHTASGGIRMPDEVITLAAGLHHAGFRHVLATLWAVDADVARLLTETVFGALTTTGRFDPGGAAEAARAAVLALRATDPGRPSRWALFTHTGP
ncbi:CHAT domain-containing protein [Micromonospora sp. NPDC049559]|uniref:CHAT domain-containing protein n=1 Tax=Micromonospora sp. NPDC049559 TaxID=3155923 RepID=UPI00342812F7